MAKGLRNVGNLPFSRGHIYRILTNRIYIGEIDHKGASYLGQHPAIISVKTWEAAQAQLATNRHSTGARSSAKGSSLLSGLIFDTTGNRLVTGHTNKKGKRYRYYVTSAGPGRAILKPTEIARIPAASVEDAVLPGLRKLLANRQELACLLRRRRFSTVQIGDAFDTVGRLTDVLISGPPSARQSLISAVVCA